MTDATESMEADGGFLSEIYVSFDPGTVNLGVAVIEVSPRLQKPRLCWAHCVGVDGERSPEPLLVFKFLEMVERAVDDVYQKLTQIVGPDITEVWVIEYQPPLATRSNPGLVRKNTWVESAIVTWAFCHSHCWLTVAPAAVKGYFQFPRVESGNQYYSNKRFAKEKAAEMLQSDRLLNEHVSDCVLNALYVSKKIEVTPQK
jgi:hypothetical protein